MREVRTSRRHGRWRWHIASVVLKFLALILIVPLIVLGQVAILATGETQEWNLRFAHRTIVAFWVAFTGWLMLVALAVLSRIKSKLSQMRYEDGHGAECWRERIH